MFGRFGCLPESKSIGSLADECHFTATDASLVNLIIDPARDSSNLEVVCADIANLALTPIIPIIPIVLSLMPNV